MNPKEQNILIVDGDKLFAELLVEQMAQLGFSSIQCAADGAGAIRAIDREGRPFDVVLCGLELSGQDCARFFQGLIRRGFDGGVVLLVESEGPLLAEPPGLDGLHALSMLGTLRKPATPQALWKVLAHRVEVSARKKPASDSILEITAQELELALEDGGMSLCYQPQVDLATGSIVGVESLLRWDHPRLGPVSPVRFVAEAEYHGLIHKLTERVFAASMAQVARWRAQGIFLNLSVNVSMQNLEMAALPDFLSAMAKRFGLPPESLTLELNESQMVTDPASVLAILSRLRDRGLGLAIENFGKGRGDLAHLSGLPFTELKISRAFILNAYQKPGALALLKNTVRLAKALGLKVVAEGVEAEWHWQMAKTIGCDLAQGYHIARPMPPAQLLPCLQHWNEVTHTVKSAYSQALLAYAV